MNMPAYVMQGDDTLSQGHFAKTIDDNGYFKRYFDTSLEVLLAPLDGEHPTGLPVRGTMIYRMVEQARRSDDVTLPMGSWAVDLKRANWPKVSTMIVTVLSGTAKDLQLASWLLEAEIHQRGFAAIAPCITLLHGLCDQWWSALHPQPDHGDYDARINIVQWVNEKLLATLSLIPLVSEGEHRASWSQWELAYYNERLIAVHGTLPEEARDAATLEDLHALLVVIKLDILRGRYAELTDARAAIADFEENLRIHLGYEAPSLGKLDDFLVHVQAPIRGEIARRGEPLEYLSAATTPDDSMSDVAAAAHDGADDRYAQTEHDDEAFTDRERAYRALADVADFLLQIEPHSPVPYLIRRAIEWGSLNAAELYCEVFQKSGGRIDIADLFGIGGQHESHLEDA